MNPICLDCNEVLGTNPECIRCACERLRWPIPETAKPKRFYKRVGWWASIVLGVSLWFLIRYLYERDTANRVAVAVSSIRPPVAAPSAPSETRYYTARVGDIWYDFVVDDFRLQLDVAGSEQYFELILTGKEGRQFTTSQTCPLLFFPQPPRGTIWVTNISVWKTEKGEK